MLKEKKSTSSFRVILFQMMLLVLCSFFFQGLFSANGSSVDAVLARIHLAVNAEQQNHEAAWLVQAPIPPKTAILLLEVDLTTEDDENRRNAVPDFSIPFGDHTGCAEGIYDRFLKHRFLHLNSRIKNRPSIAFFILYHSWKSDLS